MNESFDQCFTNALNREDGVSHMLGFFNASEEIIRRAAQPIEEVSTLYYIGHALTGGPGMLHGGIACTLMDEAMGAITEVNNVLGKDGEGFKGTSSVTGEMKVRFVKPVLTGEVVRVRATLIKAEGRRTWVKCAIEDEEGDELVRGESVWIAPRNKVGRERL